ncbi:MAG: hypothetical protein ABR878_13920, partial [Roseiarcus sp.]
ERWRIAGGDGARPRSGESRNDHAKSAPCAERVSKRCIMPVSKLSPCAFLRENAARVRGLSDEIFTAEREIDAVVYGLFDLTAEEVALLEESLEGQY